MFSSSVFGQVNLVPNFSFEQYDTCPNNEGQIERAVGWLNFGGTFQAPSTPDYYNACNSGNWNVPNGSYAHQIAFTGVAYAAIVTFASLYREYIGIELNQTLSIGQKYFISLQTCMAEALGQGCPSNKIGLRLSTVPYSWPKPLTPDNFAHVYEDSIINDSINWHLIKGSVIADSAYKYLIVGNFFNEANTDTIKYNSNSYVSYYIIDDVCLSTDSLLCAGTTSINTHEAILVELFPNPASDYINIKFAKAEYAEILIHDVFGKLVYIGNILGENRKIIDLSFLSEGCYFIRINSKKEGKTITKKIIKI
jgi:hypothetical protein